MATLREELEEKASAQYAELLVEDLGGIISRCAAMVERLAPKPVPYKAFKDVYQQAEILGQDVELVRRFLVRRLLDLAEQQKPLE